MFKVTDYAALNIIDRDTLFEPREASVSVDQSYDLDCSEAILTCD